MGRDPVLKVRIVSDSKDAVADLDRTSSKVGGLVKAAGAALVTVGIAGAVGIAKLTEDAGNLEQSIGAIDTVFKGNAKQVHTWAKNAAVDVGLTRNEFNELGTLIGTQLRNGGTAMEQLAPKTKGLITLGADLSSMFGGTTREAVEALSSALKGERDPIERYGVSLNQAAIDAEAARLGFKKVGGSLSAQANQAATLSLIMKQTADAQGNFNRETNTYAHQKQVFVAAIQDAGAALGSRFLPLATKAFGFLNTTALPALDGLFNGFDKLTSGQGLSTIGKALGIDSLLTLLNGVKAAFTPLLPVIIGFVRDGVLPLILNVRSALAPILATLAERVLPLVASAIGAILPPLRDALAAVGGFAQALSGVLVPVIQFLWPIVETVFNAVKGIVVAALKVVTAIIRTVTAALRGDWSGFWDGLKGIVAAAWNLIKAVVTGALNIIKSILSTQWTLIKNVASAAWNGIVSILSTAWTKAKSAVSSGIASVVAFVKGLPGRILTALGNLNTLLLNAGRSILTGFLDGLKRKWEDVKNFVGGIGDWIADHKGPISYDRKLLEPAGRAIMGGLNRSLRAGLPDLRRTLDTVTRTVQGTTFGSPSLALAGPTATAAPATGGAVVQVVFSGVVGDPVAVADQLQDLLDARARRNGRRTA